jgi:hypothetical protein
VLAHAWAPCPSRPVRVVTVLMMVRVVAVLMTVRVVAVLMMSGCFDDGGGASSESSPSAKQCVGRPVAACLAGRGVRFAGGGGVKVAGVGARAGTYQTIQDPV